MRVIGSKDALGAVPVGAAVSTRPTRKRQPTRFAEHPERGRMSDVEGCGDFSSTDSQFWAVEGLFCLLGRP